MLPISHWYFMMLHWDKLFPGKKPNDLLKVTNPWGPDLDMVFNKWWTLRKPYKDDPEFLHNNYADVVRKAKETPWEKEEHQGFMRRHKRSFDSLQAQSAYNGFSVHMAHDDIVHPFIYEHTDILRGDVSEILGREATDEEVHDTVEMDIEYRVDKENPHISGELMNALYTTRSYRPLVSVVFSEVFKDKGYSISPGNVHCALVASYALGRRRLKGKKYIKYFPKEGYGTKRFTVLDWFFSHLVEAMGLEQVLDAESFHELIRSDEFDESVEVVPRLGNRVKRKIDGIYETLRMPASAGVEYLL